MKINLMQIFSTINSMSYVMWGDLTKGQHGDSLNLH